MGKLIEKNIHRKADGSFLQSVDMRYHPRGWLESINDPLVASATDKAGTNPYNGKTIPGAEDDLFAQRLIYDQQITLADTAIYQRQRNGNIAGQIWRTGSGQPHAYFYQYDGINQLLYADYLMGEEASATVSDTPWQRYTSGIHQAKSHTASLVDTAHYDTEYSYDRNGNIQSALRYGNGVYDEESGRRYPEVIDDLTYGYDPQAGNRLTSVRERAARTDGMDFTERQIPSVFITQVRYNNTATDNRGQFVKVTNVGNQAVDLTGWELLTHAGEAYPIAALTLPAGGSVIIAGDQTGALTAQYGDNPDPEQFQLVNGFPYTLTQEDALTLRDAQGAVQDLVAWGALDLYGSLWNLNAHDRDDKALVREKIQALPWPGGWRVDEAAPYHSSAQNLQFNGEEYQYDANGNMTLDANKGMRVQYNAMNLPTQASFIHGGHIKWEYTASGTKVSKTVTDEHGEVILIRNYSSGFVYERYSNDTTAVDQLQFFTTETGRARLLNTGRFRLEHDLTDHLPAHRSDSVGEGNVRVSFAYNPEIDSVRLLQEDAYYPFGLKMEGLGEIYDEENKFTYNGKELADEHGLNWYHYGARFYDPQLGRWHSVDPADEFQSTFTYVGNNPITLIDPDGKSSRFPPGLLTTFRVLKEWYSKSNLYLEADANFSAGIQATGDLKAFGGKLGFDANYMSFDLLSFQAEYRNEKLKYNTTTFGSEKRLVRQSYGLNFFGGYSESKAIPINSSTGVIEKLSKVDISNQTDAILFNFGSYPIDNTNEQKLFIGQEFGFEGAFGFGFEASISFGLELDDKAASESVLKAKSDLND